MSPDTRIDIAEIPGNSREALRLGETIAVMMGGRIRQVGSPAEVFGEIRRRKDNFR